MPTIQKDFYGFVVDSSGNVTGAVNRFGVITPIGSIPDSVFASLADTWLANGGHAAQHASLGLYTPTGLGAALPKTRSKLAKIRAGVVTGTNGIDGQLRIGMVGDSTTTGAGAGTSGVGNVVGARANNVVSALRQQLVAAGLPCRADSFMGDQYVYNANPVTTYYPQYDPRVTLTGTAGSINNGAYASLGGLWFRLNASTDSISFNPGMAWDTAVIYVVDAQAGSASLSINGGASTAGISGATSITTTNIFGQPHRAVTINITKAAATLQIGNVTGSLNTGTPIIRGVWCYDSTAPNVHLYGLGSWGLQLNQCVTQFGKAFGPDAYDLVILNMSINDITALGAAGINTYSQALNTTISNVKAAGSDLILATTSATNQDDSTVAAYSAVIKSAAIVAGAPFVDLRARMGNYATANPLGLMYDQVHELPAGYQDIAAAYRAPILTL